MTSLCFYVLVFVLLADCSPAAGPSPNGPDAPHVYHELEGVARAVKPSELDELIRDNLLEDLAPWKSRKLTALDFLNLLHEIDTTWFEYRRHFIAIVAIRNNKFTWWAYPKARKWCTSRVEYAKQEFEKYANQSGLVFPDVLYVMNGYDKPLCPGNCSAPIFSFTKPWKQGCTAAAAGTTTAASHGNSSQRCSPYDDILHPVMNHPFDHLIDFPWHLKSSKAFMRAGVYAAMARNCSRVLVYRMANSRAGQKWLDVGIYKNRHPHVKLKTVDPIPMEDHARYRYLLNTDGQAASWRLAKLLAINSVILKWDSDSIEHYYRSLRPAVHYLSVNQSTLFGVLEAAEKRAGVGGQELEAVPRAAQRFAYKHLSQASRVAYASVALQHYKALFDDGLEGLLRALGPDAAPSMPALLRIREQLLAGGRLP